MALLKAPEKQPGYRERREHGSFVQRLKEAAPGADSIQSIQSIQSIESIQSIQSTESDNEGRQRFVDDLVEGCVRGADWSAVVEVSLEDAVGVLRRYQEGKAHGTGQVLLGSRLLVSS
jgi:hypothetical protein